MWGEVCVKYITISLLYYFDVRYSVWFGGEVTELQNYNFLLTEHFGGVSSWDKIQNNSLTFNLCCQQMFYTFLALKSRLVQSCTI